MKSVIVFGAGDIAEIAGFYFANDSDYTVAAYTVDREFMKSDNFGGKPLVAFEDLESHYSPQDHALFVALSYAKLNRLRAEKCAAAKRKGYRLAAYLSTKATVWPGFSLGENCFILEDNTIQPFVRIGNNVTLWSGNHIGHHAQIGDNCFITSHVVISGGVKVGDYSFIGVNATIRDHVTIGAGCVIGAGSLIVKDAADDSVYSASAAELARVPASRLRKI
jgi:sugar O-acyltransferase (sialic acid O-acetyltransferase NeuD family)